MHNILLRIIEKKEKDLLKQKKIFSVEDLKRKISAIQFKSKFKSKIVLATNIAIIAEIKLTSPTTPSLDSENNIIQRAISYEKARVEVISFITEKHFFKGNSAFISQLKTKISIPVLQKDFVIDPYQIYEAKMLGSDAILLIARLLNKNTLKDFVILSQKIGIEPVVEINDKEDLEKAINTNTSFIAVNARDLRTFKINIAKACALLKQIPDKFIKLGFSGIKSSLEVKDYGDAGARGVLIGTSLMKSKDINQFIHNVRNI